MSWVLIVYLLATGNVMFLDTGYPSKAMCDEQGTLIVKELGPDKIGYACERGEMKYGEPKNPNMF